MPAPQPLIEALQEIYNRHSDAVDQGDLRRVFRENLRFHRTLFSACGNAPLTEIIEQLAFKTHGIRSYAVGDPEIVRGARREHLMIIELLQTDRRDELIALVKQHLEPPKNVYLRLARHKTLREASFPPR
jgi:DNA-binding GntR family transcriptional regulator